ncbi:MAG: response regulator [Chitinophagaceae bacterium]|nr:MAG: response regulator [Chitinophagaceae bacterium]
MMESDIDVLRKRIEELEKENAVLRQNSGVAGPVDSVAVPPEIQPVFQRAQETVSSYFRQLRLEPGKGTIEINDERYVLVRASTLSKDFLQSVQGLYADRGEEEALSIGKNLLFDVSHVLGINDARNFHHKMNLTDPLAKLSAGPVHFAYSGWAFVEILPESNPVPGNDFYLVYNHPYSFEADSWVRAGVKASSTVCIMNSGYSSGWCEESFGIPLTAVEVSCIARGDKHCTFIMSPPERIEEHLAHFHKDAQGVRGQGHYTIPTFFQRKQVEEEMQRARQMAEASAKMKTDFLANMSHELRTPLGAILGFTGLLKKTAVDKQQLEYIDTISQSGNSLLGVINDVLDLSRLEAGKYTIRSSVFNVSELMASLHRMFMPMATGKGLRLDQYTDEEIGWDLNGDAARLSQVLTNLVGNAIKFTAKGSVGLFCELVKENDQEVDLLFRVQDTGPGIPPDKIDMIFDRFTQADMESNRQFGGAGLGLAISRQLTELMGGELSILNRENGGVECVLTIRLPKAAVGAGQVLNGEGLGQELVQRQYGSTGQYGHFRQSSLQPRSDKPSVMIVEDNPINQKLVGIMLTNNSYNVVTAGSGEEAISILTGKTGHQPVDLILLDIQMPGMDGYETCRRIRADLGINVPVIAITAHALDGECEKCYEAGMHDYLAKPFTEEQLLERVAALLNKKGNEGPLVNLDFLRRQSGTNDKLLTDMIQLFRQQVPEQLDKIRDGLANGNVLAVAQAVHVLRNSTGFFGLTPVLGDDLLAMEREARTDGSAIRLAQMFERTEPIFRQVLEELETFIQTKSR